MRGLQGNRRRMAVIGVAGVAVGALAGPPVTASAVKAVQDVFVTNTAANPVPVTGSVAVSGGTPFMLDGHLPLAPGQPHPDGHAAALPAGKALIVEFVSAGGRDFDNFMIHSGSGETGNQTYYLPLTFRDLSTNELTYGSEMTKFRLDDDVYVHATLREGAGNGTAEWQIGGYLVDE